MGDVIQFPGPRTSAVRLNRLQTRGRDFVEHYQAEHDGAWPSIETIGAELKIRSRTGVIRILNALFAAGALQRPESIVR